MWVRLVSLGFRVQVFRVHYLWGSGVRVEGLDGRGSGDPDV